MAEQQPVIYEIRVGFVDPGDDVFSQQVYEEIQRTIGIDSLESVKVTNVYKLQGATEEEARRLAETVFSEPVIGQTYSINEPLITGAAAQIEVGGVIGYTNPEAGFIMEAAQLLGIKLQAADSSREYGFYGDVHAEEIKHVVDRLLVNPVTQRIVYERPNNIEITGEIGPVMNVPVRNVSDEELLAISERGLGLSLESMRSVQQYFQEKAREPTDCELGIISASWSDHCKHTTFNARLIIDGESRPSLFSQIKDASMPFMEGVLSAYVDNSGVIKGPDGIAVCGKVETHNHPSAIDPEGGATTGSGGVIRDILATAGGAQPIAATDMFCFGPADSPVNEVPPGCKHPDYTQRKVVEGVAGYNNPYGLPVVNGSVHYDKDYRARPLVIVGTYGKLPAERSQKGEPQVGDLVVVLGGRTGKDGLGGAVGSSSSTTPMSAELKATEVQDGNPIVQLKLQTALLEAADKNLIRAINDFGAAGIASAIGEMGKDIGVQINIDRVLLKYRALAPWEIILSESQERMAFAIPPENIDALLAICAKYEVEASVLGYFDGSHKFTVRYGDQIVADLDYDFLNDGFPRLTLEGHWEKPIIEEKIPDMPEDFAFLLKQILAHPDIASKEPIVRRYDHGVQGTVVVPPYGGVQDDAPRNAGVVRLSLGKPGGVVIAHGISTGRNKLDPYRGAKWAVAEALANYVATGGDPRTVYYINNFINASKDAKSIGAVQLIIQGLTEAMSKTKRPVISGKDSNSSRYKGADGTVIDIPPTFCLSAFGIIDDVEKSITPDIKKPGESVLCLVGTIDDRSMGGSTYYDIVGGKSSVLPDIDFDQVMPWLIQVFEANQVGEILACHDISEGGLAVTLSEMCFGGDCGADIVLDVSVDRLDFYLTGETAGSLVVEVANEETAHRLFAGMPHKVLGATKQDKELRVDVGTNGLFRASVDELKQANKEPLQMIFH